MPPTTKKAPAEAPNAYKASMNASQAFIGLHLHENLEIAEALEFFVRGYIDCATTEGLAYVPSSCAEQALKTFAHHGSWGSNGFPWDRLDRDWRHAAMKNLVHRVRDGHSLAEKPVDEVSEPDDRQVATGGVCARHSVEEDVDEPDFFNDEASVSMYNDDEGEQDSKEDDNAPGPSVAPLLLKGKVAASKTDHAALPASQSVDLPYELVASSSESPSQLAALNRMRKYSSALLASSSSPLSTMPSSMFKTRPAASANIERRQTRSVTRAASSSSSRSETPDSNISMASSRQSIRLQQKKKKQATATATATGEMMWSFDTLLDSRIKGEDVEYKIKWTQGRATWQPSLDLRDTPDEIGAFHEKYPEKVGPPSWYARGVAKAEYEEAEWVED